jgi:hypothetical protein
VRVRHVVLVVALALVSWFGAELVLDIRRTREPRPVPPIVLEVRDDRPERRGKGDRRADRGGSPSSGAAPVAGAQPALPPAPPPAGDDDDDGGERDDSDDGGGSDD